MTVSELIERLQDFDPEAEVRMAIQPSWPLQFTLAGVVDSNDDSEAFDAWQEDHQHCENVDWADSHCKECDEQFGSEDGDEESIIYLMQGDHPGDSPYASKSLWGQL